MNFEETSGDTSARIEVAHDRGLCAGAENVSDNENMNEDEEINQLVRARAGRIKLTLNDKLIQRKLVTHFRDMWKNGFSGNGFSTRRCEGGILLQSGRD